MPHVSVQSRRVFGEVGLEHVERAIGIAIANGNAHASLFSAVFVNRQSRLQALFRESAIAAIVEQEAGSGVTSHVDLLPAVTVQVSSDSRQPVCRRDSSNAGASGNVSERPVAIVAIEHRTFTNQAARPAIHRDALEITGWILSCGWDFIEAE